MPRPPPPAMREGCAERGGHESADDGEE
jgi:hypothetical protein